VTRRQQNPDAFVAGPWVNTPKKGRKEEAMKYEIDWIDPTKSEIDWIDPTKTSAIWHG
jgi:hypothetical protein